MNSEDIQFHVHVSHSVQFQMQRPHPRMLEHKAHLTHQTEYSWPHKTRALCFILYKLTHCILECTCSKDWVNSVAAEQLSGIDSVWGACLWNSVLILEVSTAGLQFAAALLCTTYSLIRCLPEYFPGQLLGQTWGSPGKIGWTWFWLSRRSDSELDLQTTANGYE